MNDDFDKLLAEMNAMLEAEKEENNIKIAKIERKIEKREGPLIKIKEPKIQVHQKEAADPEVKAQQHKERLEK